MVDYALMEKTIRNDAKEEPHFLPVLSNAVALIMNQVPGVNWVGFYLADERGLYLGPFQGKPSIPRIPAGKGISGLAAKKNDTIYVSDVHDNPDYLASDPATDSEVVIPLRSNKKVIGVLVIDSPILNRFPVTDRDNLRRFVAVIEKSADFSSLTGETPANSPKKQSAKQNSMPFELWLYAIKGLAQTYEMVGPIYAQLSEQEKKALKAEYEKSN
ncbi:MAG: GAF domain-containing protein [Lachnospiraceae bacterium]|nr:GAF domain-containing protein [Lachnospiraceae bacterium]